MRNLPHWTRWLIGLTLALGLLFSAGVVLAQDATAASSSSTLITILRHTHSLVRWLVVLTTIVAIVKLAMGYFNGGAYDALTRRIMVIFSGVVTLQWVIGLIFLIAYGSVVGFGLRHFWEHLLVMTLALGLSHMHNSKRWRGLADRLRYRNSLLLVLGVLLLVIVGVALLPQGWRIAPA
ncbi:MAG: hypothetical protein JNM70_20815 [Anaerolineae bacterium]|nr:hypothetical protein [Anaerolineae bacterium]